MRNLVAQDEQTAWFTADGLVFATSNGGASWTARALLPGVIIDLRRVGTNDLWAVGTEGGIWRSRDGGLTWTTQASGVTQSLFSIDSVDGVTAWAVGLSGTTLKTTNGGLNWAPQRVLPPGSEESLSQVDMVDAQTIWLVRSGGAVLVSNNGGLTWTTREHRKNVYRLVALDGTRAVASGFGAMVTNDGGQT
ncbi:MAG: WD40/YVTN/BNR-like repeat-containing protein, partial [Betaproteobacteria bacterium]